MTVSRKHKALVTGGSRGIGLAIALCLKDYGIDVLTPTRQEMDLSSTESIANYLSQVETEGIDILVNNAGINMPEPLESMGMQNLSNTIKINLEAPLQLIQGVAPFMRQNQWGRIVNVSSIFSLVSRSGRAAYTASKAGLNGLTMTSALELAPYNILVNAVCPGYVATDLTYANNPPEVLDSIVQTIPLQRLAQPADIAEVVAFLCSESNRYLTGQVIAVDGGFLCQ